MILALDASTEVGSAALVESGRLVRDMVFQGGGLRGGGAASALEEIAAEAEVGGVVVGLGPGSYSGVRAAVAAAWGFALARGIPLRGVSSLLGLAPGEFLAVGDARREEFYFAHVRDGEFVEPPRLVHAGQLRDLLDGQANLPVLAPAELGEVCARAQICTPKAAMLAGFGVEGGGGGRVTPSLPQPLYLKAPHITLPRAR